MTITYLEQEQLFHLQSKDMSYIIQLNNGYPLHVYWGKKLRSVSNITRLLHYPDNASIDRYPQEYPQYGTGDFRNPAYQVRLEDGSRITELVYESHKITEGKPKLPGLPAVYVESERESQTLEIKLVDHYSGLSVTLSYTVFEDHNAISRSVQFLNCGSQSVSLERALSASVDFIDSDYEMIYLAGGWAREAQVKRRVLEAGLTTIESRRGASSAQFNPFMALARPNTDEDQGEVFGFSLVYSGSFVAETEVDYLHSTRVSIGINPFDFGWLLEPGESFQTPEAIMVYSTEGLGGMSRTYHRLYRTRLCRGIHRDQERPILVNNWEATYFDFNAEKIESIAKSGAELGIELFVLDDGWFGKRNDDTTSLGDWIVDRTKLPEGLTNLAERVNSLGLLFGLWFEPEMVSPDSDLYRQHPDWCIHVEGRRRTEGRTQLILDLSRQEVCDYLLESLSKIFTSVPISYVKWDMNRNMTEIGSATRSAVRQKETAHRYMLGLYDLLEKLTHQFPHILFESCASGGGRFDPGMLYYMPQTWTSDNTDAIERLKIQFGTSMVYPVSTIGAHVSAVPNHQMGRTTSLVTRGDVAMSGNFGYEMDLTTFSDDEKVIAKQQVAHYKEIRSLVQQGDLYRLRSPFEGNETAWMFVSEDKAQALVYYFQVLAEPNAPLKKLKLKGLDPELDYTIDEEDIIYGGDRLMHSGLHIPPLHGDFVSKCFHLKAKV
ncbi:alpha-galactosidase [Paenibacillus antarcticus]|uniref:Alpha-galactosidase n=1 Tax=Paenibacillus antarcticus TaxID=253703 RepID=A0A168J7U8_9BACL|nr:alpha-galactosidase [Paenibacillus antarcticus]OAB40262.1 alpha-galactosidase [Paenibacillus antarcticus]